MRLFLLGDKDADLLVRVVRFRRDQMSAGTKGIKERLDELGRVDTLYKSLFGQEFVQRSGQVNAEGICRDLWMELARDQGCYPEWPKDGLDPGGADVSRFGVPFEWRRGK